MSETLSMVRLKNSLQKAETDLREARSTLEYCEEEVKVLTKTCQALETTKQALENLIEKKAGSCPIDQGAGETKPLARNRERRPARRTETEQS